MKSEPLEFSIDDLEKKIIARWDGVRNYQARNFIKSMQEGDRCFFYHSSCESPGIYGSMKILGQPYPDPLATEPNSIYYYSLHQEKGNPWLSIDIVFEKKFLLPLTLATIKSLDLGPTPLTTRGNRLSIIPLTAEQFKVLYTEALRQR